MPTRGDRERSEFRPSGLYKQANWPLLQKRTKGWIPRSPVEATATARARRRRAGQRYLY